MNMPQLTPTQRYLAQTLLKLIGAALATHGATRIASFLNTSDTVEAVGGIIALIVGLVAGYKTNTTAAVQQAAADTLPVGTVLPATTDAAPKAQILPPEQATEFIRKSAVQTSTDAVQPKP